MYIVVNIERKRIKYSVFETLSDRIPKNELAVPSREYIKYRFAIPRTKEAIKALSEGSQLQGVCISFPGEYTQTETKITGSESYPSWDGANLQKDLTNIECPIYVENDAVISAIGEYSITQEQRKQAFIYLAPDGAISAAVINHIQQKMLVYPVELGDIVVVLDGQQCECGQKGCLRQYLAIERTYGIPEEDADDEILVLTARYLTQGLMTLLTFYPVQTVTFGGETIHQRREFLEKIMQYASKMLAKKFTTESPVLRLSSVENGIIEKGALAYMATYDEIINMRYPASQAISQPSNL